MAAPALETPPTQQRAETSFIASLQHDIKREVVRKREEHKREAAQLRQLEAVERAINPRARPRKKRRKARAVSIAS